MRARTGVRGAVSFTLFASLAYFCGGSARAAEEEKTTPSEASESEPAAKPKPAPAAEQEPASDTSPPAEEAPKATPGLEVEFKGWKISLEGRVNAFVGYGWGNRLPTYAPDTGLSLIEGGGLSLHDNQTNADGKFGTVRIRNGFVPNLFTLKVRRNLTATTTLQAVFSAWADIQTNLSVYLQPQTYMQESYLKLEGPWGSFTGGRQMALFSRGAVEIDFLYAHGNGVGWPCNFNGILPACGQIGFGVMFPFFRAGLLYQTPSLGGLTFAAGAYDPVILAGKWARIITPTFEAELAFTRQLQGLGMFKVFASGVWQRLGAPAVLGDPLPGMPDPPPDTRTIARKTVDQAGVAGGARVEIGFVRLGLAAHYGKGLGFYYAQENSQAAYFSAPDQMDPRDGDLRTFRGFYGQLTLVLGQINVGAGAGASQLVPLSYEDTTTTHLPKQNFGINGIFSVRIADNVVWGLDYFRAEFSWYGTVFKQTVHAVNTGITVTF